MPVLNFKKQFAPMVESGLKRQTIRARRKDGRNPQPGQTLYLYTGMRTTGCRKLKEVICKSCETIVIEEVNIIVGRNLLSVDEKYVMAKKDGFEYIDDFRNFFLKTHGLPFYGFLIKW